MRSRRKLRPTVTLPVFAGRCRAQAAIMHTLSVKRPEDTGMARSGTSTARHHANATTPDCARCMARDLAICTALTTDESDELERLARHRTLGPNAVLAASGQPALHVYSVTDGMLRRVRTLADGRRLVTGFSLPGDFIGLSDAASYRTSIEAVTASQVCEFELDAIRALSHRFPKLEHKLLERACMELDASQDAMLMLARLSPLERLAGFLLQLGQQLRRCAPGSAAASSTTTITLPMSRHDIADHLGLTVETVSRSFTRLRQMHLITLPDPQWVEIHDADGLQRLANAAG